MTKLKLFIFALLVSSQAFAQTTTTTGEKILAGKKGSSTNIQIQANVSSSNKPEVRYDKTANKWKLSHDGTNFSEVGTAGGYVQAISASDIDWSLASVFTKTLAANTTFTFSNQIAGQVIMVRLTNTASNYTVTWPVGVLWPAGVAPTQTVGAKSDIITFLYDGTNTYGNTVQNF